MGRRGGQRYSINKNPHDQPQRNGWAAAPPYRFREAMAFFILCSFLGLLPLQGGHLCLQRLQLSTQLKGLNGRTCRLSKERPAPERNTINAA